MSVDRIVTSHVRPPIPTRGHDWQATFAGSPEGPAGRGASEQDAIDDLVDSATCDCDLELVASELDSGRCACCGKAVFA